VGREARIRTTLDWVNIRKRKKSILKSPKETPGYKAWSDYVRSQLSAIIENSIEEGNNKIYIYTNLKSLPLENINKVAGPFIEAWALELFEGIVDNEGNEYTLINVEAGKRLDAFDIVLQFKRGTEKTEYITSHVDVKATAEDIATSGRRPNIISYARIRNEYLKDPDYIFIVLSLKHKVYSERNKETKMVQGTMEVVSFSVYDLKFVSSADLNYNPALGYGQLQIRDIHYVTEEIRTVAKFLRFLDKKYIKTHGEKKWLELAIRMRGLSRERCYELNYGIRKPIIRRGRG
jgi:hypothetical protein